MARKENLSVSSKIATIAVDNLMTPYSGHLSIDVTTYLFQIDRIPNVTDLIHGDVMNELMKIINHETRHIKFRGSTNYWE